VVHPVKVLQFVGALGAATQRSIDGGSSCEGSSTSKWAESAHLEILTWPAAPVLAKALKAPRRSYFSNSVRCAYIWHL
jgi:hypothetical protein